MALRHLNGGFIHSVVEQLREERRKHMDAADDGTERDGSTRSDQSAAQTNHNDLVRHDHAADGKPDRKTANANTHALNGS